MNEKEKAPARAVKELDMSELFTLAGQVFVRIKRELAERMELEVAGPHFREMLDLFEVARALQSVCATMGNRPPFTRGEAILRAIDYGNLERAAHGDGKVYAPTRAGVIAGLTSLIEGRERQMDEFVAKHIGECIVADLNTAHHGIATAFRSVRRERDAFVLARDYA